MMTGWTRLSDILMTEEMSVSENTGNLKNLIKIIPIFLKANPRYKSLFSLDVTDYKGWARGLKRAGYATNPEYANMLIRKIEEYNLYKL